MTQSQVIKPDVQPIRDRLQSDDEAGQSVRDMDSDLAQSDQAVSEYTSLHPVGWVCDLDMGGVVGLRRQSVVAL